MPRGTIIFPNTLEFFWAAAASAEAAAAQAIAADVSSQRESYSGLYNGSSTDAKFCRRD